MAANDILARLAVLITANNADFGKALAQSQSSLKKFESAISKTNGILTSFGVGFGLTQVTAAVGNAIGIIIDFEKQMSTVKAITGATGKEFNTLRQSALDLGKSTQFSSQQVAELQTEYGRLGFSTSEILAASKATIDLSIATGSDLAKAAEVAGSTIRGFGLNANETQRVVDVMAESFNRSALGIENFSEAMKYVAPIAAQAGIFVEETTAMLGTLADAGIKGSMAGTSLRKIITDLGGESGTLSEKLQSLAAKGLTGAEAMSEVGRTAYASLLVLAKNTEKTNDLTTALSNAAGAGERMAKVMSDNLAGDIDELSSAYEGLILSSDGATDSMRELVQAATSAVRGLADPDNAFGRFLDKFGEVSFFVYKGALSLIGYSHAADEASEASDELAKKTAAVNNTVKAAFDSGNIEAYIKALDQNIYKEEIIAEIRKRQTAEIVKQAQAITPQSGLIQSTEDKLKAFEEAKKNAFSTKEIAGFTAKIEGLREQLDLLNANRPLSNFAKNLAPSPQDGTATPDFDLPITKPDGLKDMFPSEVPAPDTSAYMDALRATTDATKAAGVSAIKSYDQMRLAQDLQIDKQKEQADAAAEYGTVIGNALGSALSGQKSFADSMKQLTAELLKTFLARALGGIISGAATSGAPPPIAIALAAAGVAAISGMFAAIGGGSSTTSSRTRTAAVSSRAASHIQNPDSFEITIGGEWRIRGADLVYIFNREQQLRGRTGR